jgi:hypothetical protein
MTMTTLIQFFFFFFVKKLQRTKQSNGHEPQPPPQDEGNTDLHIKPTAQQTRAIISTPTLLFFSTTSK